MRHDPRFDTGHWPSELRYRKDERVLEVEFEDGATFALPAEYLRVESPSAEVQGHGRQGRTLVAGRSHVGIIEIEPEGNYAVRLIFDDLHDTGIYTWRYLRDLGEEMPARWAAYLAELEAAGLSRHP